MPRRTEIVAPESDFAARDLAVRMDDLEFDFEDDINATDVGQPQQAPETLPDRARKNYRQVRGRHAASRIWTRTFDRRSAPNQP